MIRVIFAFRVIVVCVIFAFRVIVVRVVFGTSVCCGGGGFTTCRGSA